MWDNQKQQRLDDLRRRAQRGTLTKDEQQMLDTLLRDLEQAEWAAIRPALSKLRDEQEAIQEEIGQLGTKNTVLSALAERYADLLARARVQLTGLVREREALRTAYERALQDVAQS